MYEDYSKNIDHPDLTSEQNKILVEINDIIKFFIKKLKFIDERDKKLYDERQEKIRTFIHELKDRGFISNEYILGRRMIGGTSEEYDTEFDTPDHDIEKFIRSLEK